MVLLKYSGFKEGLMKIFYDSGNFLLAFFFCHFRHAFISLWHASCTHLYRLYFFLWRKYFADFFFYVILIKIECELVSSFSRTKLISKFLNQLVLGRHYVLGFVGVFFFSCDSSGVIRCFFFFFSVSIW